MASTSLAPLPEIGRVVTPPVVGMWTQNSFGAIDPNTMNAILRQAEKGGPYALERYGDLCEWIGEDELISALLDTRLDQVTAMPFDIVPGSGDPALAEAAANAVREMMANVENVEQVLEGILSGIWPGYSLSEHDWKRKNGMWVSRPANILTRDVELAPDWSFRARTYNGGSSGTWLNCDEHQGKFIGMQYRNRGSSPLRSGLMRKVAWFWLFKRWAFKYWVAGAARLANPIAIGTVGPNASERARTDLQAGLDHLSEGQTAILEENTGIQFPDTKFSTSSQVWSDLVDKLNDGIVIAILGSVDNVDGGGSGSAARATSQAEQTIEPRKLKLAKLLYGVCERDWFTPFLSYNSDKFGGVMPPVPRMQVKQSLERSIGAISQFHLMGRLVTRDEVRAQLGLDPLEPGMGGEELLDINPAAPAVDPLTGLPVGTDTSAPIDTMPGTAPVGGPDAVAPLAQGSTGTSMGRTSSPSQTKLTGSGQGSLLGDQASLQLMPVLRPRVSLKPSTATSSLKSNARQRKQKPSR